METDLEDCLVDDMIQKPCNGMRSQVLMELLPVFASYSLVSYSLVGLVACDFRLPWQCS
jgi:hypothetical protein